MTTAAEHPEDPATVAHRRLREGLLAWGGSRPEVPRRLAVELRAELEARLAELDLATAGRGRRDGRVWITKSRLDRLVCDGYQLDYKPFEHSWSNARGTLAHKAIERDWDVRRSRDVEDVVARAWDELASDRPGDPRSLAAWLNACSGDEAAGLRDEVSGLLAGFREVWPPLERVEVVPEPRIRLRLAGGRVVMFGMPDIVLRSPRDDGYCRTLLVDLKTGRPRSDHDRHELRFYALLATLDDGRPPFRWATFYVTEGRSEWEDLNDDTLHVTVRRVVDGVRQAVRIARAEEDGGELHLAGGAWCRFCRREDTCEVAAEARVREELSHPPGMLGT
jgi:hypothetical protein